MTETYIGYAYDNNTRYESASGGIKIGRAHV